MLSHQLFRPQITERVWKGTGPLASLQVPAIFLSVLSNGGVGDGGIIHREKNKLSGG